MFGLSWTLFLLQLTSALGHSILEYPLFRVGSRTCADRGSVALLLWKLPLASDDGLVEARNTLQELTGVVAETQPSVEQQRTLFRKLHGGVWWCASRKNGHEQLEAMGINLLQRSALLGGRLSEARVHGARGQCAALEEHGRRFHPDG